MVMQKEMSESLKEAARDAMLQALMSGKTDAHIGGKFPSFSVSADKNAQLGINMGNLSLMSDGIEMTFYVFQRLA